MKLHAALDDVVALRNEISRSSLSPTSFLKIANNAASQGAFAAAAELLHALSKSFNYSNKYSYGDYDEATHAYAETFPNSVARDDAEFAWFVRAFLAARDDSDRSDDETRWKPRAERLRDVAKEFAKIEFVDAELQARIESILAHEPSTAEFFCPDINLNEAKLFEILAQPEVDTKNHFFVRKFLIQLILDNESDRAVAIALEAHRRKLPASVKVSADLFRELSSALGKTEGAPLFRQSWFGYASYAVAADASSRGQEETIARMIELVDEIERVEERGRNFSIARMVWENFAWHCPEGAWPLGIAMRERLELRPPNWWEFAARRGRNAGLKWDNIEDIERGLVWVSTIEGEIPDFLTQLWMLRALVHNRLEFQDEILSWAAAQPDPKPYAIQQLLAAGAIRDNPEQSGIFEAMRDRSTPLAMRQFLFGELTNMHDSLKTNLYFRLAAADLAIEAIEANTLNYKRSDGYYLMRGLWVFGDRPVPRNEAWEKQAERTLGLLHIPEAGDDQLRNHVAGVKLHLVGHLRGKEAAHLFFLENKDILRSATAALNRGLPELAAKLFAANWRTRWEYFPALEEISEIESQFLTAIEDEDIRFLAEFWLATRRRELGGGEIELPNRGDLAKRFLASPPNDEEVTRFVIGLLESDLQAARILADAGLIREPEHSLEDLMKSKTEALYRAKVEDWNRWIQFLGLTGQIEQLQPIVHVFKKYGGQPIDGGAWKPDKELRRDSLVEAAIEGIALRLKSEESSPEETVRLADIAADLSPFASKIAHNVALIRVLASLAETAELSEKLAGNMRVLAAFTKGWPLEERLALRNFWKFDSGRIPRYNWFLRAAQDDLFTDEELLQTAEQLLEDPNPQNAIRLKELASIAKRNQRWDLAEACCRAALQHIDPANAGYPDTVFNLFDARLKTSAP